VAILYLLFALFIVATWRWPQLGALVPDRLSRMIYPIDKTNMDILRLLHFLAISYLTVRLVPHAAQWLGWRWLGPIVWCGQQSLQIFCLGIFLSLLGHFALTSFGDRWPVQLAVALGGIALMAGSAFIMTWYKMEQKAFAKSLAPTSS
jgi:hypothetical protein